jgi:hypothetical protein
MPGTALGLLFAIVGALVLAVGTYYFALRDQYTGRRGALLVVLQDFKDAAVRIRKTLDSGQLWPTGEHLAPATWIAERQVLAPQVEQSAWDWLQELHDRLEAADRDVWKLRANGTNVLDSDLRKKLEDLSEEIGRPGDEHENTVLDKLGDSISGTKWAPRLALLVGVGVLALGLGLLWPSTPTWTNTPLVRALQNSKPRAALAVCDSSTTVDGAFTCMARYRRCTFNLANSSKVQTCSPAVTVTYSVVTGNSCYVATPSSVVLDSDPGPSVLGRIRKLLDRSGCTKIRRPPRRT